MIDIKDQHLAIVRTILHAWIPHSTVWAFGSRVRGQAKPYSDLDLVIIGKEKCPTSLLYQLQDAFEESTLPYRVDIIDWHRITPAFQKIIQQQKMILIETSETGHALITALLIMTLIAIMTTTLMSHLNTDILRSRMILDSDKSYLAAQLVPFWSMSQLSKDDHFPSVHPNGTIASLPQEATALYPGYKITGKLYDLQARFNLNNLSQPSMQPIFLNLLQHVDPTLSPSLKTLIITASQDWITPSPSLAPNNFSHYYKTMIPPYQSAHQPMVSVSEWNQVAGVQPELYKKLSPFLTTLPEVTRINLNTASKTLIQALNPHLAPHQLEDFIRSREQNNIQSQATLLQWARILNIDPSLVTYQSHYFLSVATVKTPTKTMKLYDKIKRFRKNPHEPWQTSIIMEHR